MLDIWRNSDWALQGVGMGRALWGELSRNQHFYTTHLNTQFCKYPRHTKSSWLTKCTYFLKNPRAEKWMYTVFFVVIVMIFHKYLDSQDFKAYLHLVIVIITDSYSWKKGRTWFESRSFTGSWLFLSHWYEQGGGKKKVKYNLCIWFKHVLFDKSIFYT